MSMMNPRRLKFWRDQRKLSMAELADLAAVATSTVFRIENTEGMRKTRGAVLRALAEALNVSLDELSSETEPVHKPVEERPKSNTTVTLSNMARNAYRLVAQRYGVKPRTIQELAPLLFLLVAEQSLKSRASELEELASQAERYADGPAALNDALGDFICREHKSIHLRDLFGRHLDAPNAQPRWAFGDADELGHWNPLENHLREWLQNTDEQAELIWQEDGPHYRICRESALELAKGNEELATALQNGNIGFHEIPKELLEPEKEEELHEWGRSKIAEMKEEADAKQAAFEEALRASLMTES